MQWVLFGISENSYCCSSTIAISLKDALGAIWTLDKGKNVLRARMDLGNGSIEEVEWKAVLLDLPDGGSAMAYAVGSGSLIWEEFQS